MRILAKFNGIQCHTVRFMHSPEQLQELFFLRECIS